MAEKRGGMRRENWGGESAMAVGGINAPGFKSNPHGSSDNVIT